MKILAFILCLILSPALTAQDEPDFIEEITTIDDFKKMEGAPLSAKFGQVSALKIVYRIKDQKMFYIHSTRYQYHINFCEEFLGYYKGSFTFNFDNYTKTDKREFLLATINHYEGKDFYTLEFSVADQIRVDQIEELYENILSSFHITDSIRLFLNTAGLEERYEQSKSTLPVIQSDEIYGSQVYQSLKTGVSYGRIIFYDVNGEIPDLWPDDIVVLKGTPNDLPPVAGVICNEFQTPLCHISILCQNRGTPFMALKGAWEQTNLVALKDKIVRMQVRDDDYVIQLAHQDSARAYFEARAANKKVYDLKTDLSVNHLLSLEDMHHGLTNVVGAKAANFGELAKVLSKRGTKSKVPESAFSIPFIFYVDHVENAGAVELIEQLVKLPKSERTAQSKLLDSIRTLIRNHPVDPELLNSIDSTVIALGDYRRMRFRSSTNAEDIEGFNGAGLYSSATGIVGADTGKTVQKALQKVWSSVWNDRAFFERQFFGIQQNKVAMGVLVHRSFPEELANGVAITKNIYRESYLGFVLNVQDGETSVVNPPYGVICDQLICYSDSENTFFNPKKIIEYISKSSLRDGQTVLDDAEIIAITKELSRVKKHFYRKVNKNWLKYEFEKFGLDLEFKIDGESRQIYIKQVRPYND